MLHPTLGRSSGGPPGGHRTGGAGIVNLEPIGAFYADYGLVTSPDSAHLQGAFDALIGLFDQVGLRTNKGEMGSTTCKMCHTPHTW